MAEEESIELSLLRQKLPTTWAQYRFITVDLKIDLPKWEKMNKRPKWATEKYLLGVIFGKYFSIKKESVKEPEIDLKDCSKGQLIKILETLAQKELGFEKGREPKKEWLKKIIYSLDPNNEIFRRSEDKIRKIISKE